MTVNIYCLSRHTDRVHDSVIGNAFRNIVHEQFVSKLLLFSQPPKVFEPSLFFPGSLGGRGLGRKWEGVGECELSLTFLAPFLTRL